MKLDCNGNPVEPKTTEIEVINNDGEELHLELGGNYISIADYTSDIFIYSTEALDNLIKGLQLAKKLGWLQEPKLVDDVADLELDADVGDLELEAQFLRETK